MATICCLKRVKENSDPPRSASPKMAPEDSVHPEAVLKRAVMAGDEQAWQVLYDGAYEMLYRYVHWRCGGATALVEETVQETWLTAVRRIRHFDPGQANFQTWIRGIAANILRNQFRRRRKLPLNLVETDIEAVMTASPAAALESREQAELVAAALAALPQHYEEVLRAKYVDAQPVAEIAQFLNQTPKAIESLLTRARAAFRRECLQQDDLAE